MIKNNVYPIIILTNPQMGENIGATMRAMCNFGLHDLRLVNPRDGWPNERASAMASGAMEKVKVSVFDTVEQAVADLHYVMATTARDRDVFKDVQTPEEAANQIIYRIGRSEKVGYMFGAERTGLTNEELSFAHSIITIPTTPDFSSLNLAQSVLLVTYEWFKKEKIEPLPCNIHKKAKQEKLNSMLGRLEEELDNHGFFRSPDLRPNVIGTIRNMFLRADLYEQEVRTMHGIISALIGNKVRK